MKSYKKHWLRDRAGLPALPYHYMIPRVIKTVKMFYFLNNWNNPHPQLLSHPQLVIYGYVLLLYIPKITGKLTQQLYICCRKLLLVEWSPVLSKIIFFSPDMSIVLSSLVYRALGFYLFDLRLKCLVRPVLLCFENLC